MSERGSPSGTLGARLRTEGPQILRILVAAALSWQVCVWLGAAEPPIFAVIVPLVSLRDHPYSAFNLSFDRLIGVVGGVVLAVAVLQFFGLSLVSIIVVLGVGLSVGIVLRVGTTLNVQIAVSCLLVFASVEPETVAFTRVWETAVGAVVSVLLSPLLFPPNARRAFEAELHPVVVALRDQLIELRQGLEADTLQSWTALQDRAIETEERARALPGSLAAARRAVANNPLRTKDRLPLADRAGELDEVVELARIERLLVDEVEAFADRADWAAAWPSVSASLVTLLEPTSVAVDAALRRPAHRLEIERARQRAYAELLRWRAADHQPLSVVLRRPVNRMLDVIGENSGS